MKLRLVELTLLNHCTNCGGRYSVVYPEKVDCFDCGYIGHIEADGDAEIVIWGLDEEDTFED